MSDNTRNTSNAGDEKSSPPKSLRDYRERMFGEDGRCEFDDQGKCVRGKRFYRRRAKAALNRAHDIRKFEIELLWKRAAYVATFQTLLFAALGFSFRTESNIIVSLFQIVTCIAGIFTSFFWRVINEASRLWHKNWTYHIDFLECEFEGKLLKTVLHGKAESHSVSRANIYISRVFFVAWVVLALFFAFNFFVAVYKAVVCSDFIACFEHGEIAMLIAMAIVLIVSIFAMALSLMSFRQKLKTKFKDTGKEGEAYLVDRDLPKNLKPSMLKEGNS